MRDTETKVVSASGEKRKNPLERVKKKKRTISLSCANMCRRTTLEKIFYFSSHILEFLLFI